MFDFILFFLVFLPIMDGLRQIRKLNHVTKLLLTAAVTSLTGSYFGYTSILAEKPTNFYELLDIPARGVSSSQLKKAFNKASLRWHPDKNPDEDTTDIWLEIKNAQETIKDENKRFAYDVYA